MPRAAKPTRLPGGGLTMATEPDWFVTERERARHGAIPNATDPIATDVRRFAPKSSGFALQADWRDP